MSISDQIRQIVGSNRDSLSATARAIAAKTGERQATVRQRLYRLLNSTSEPLSNLEKDCEALGYEIKIVAKR
jgi:hypothetical protein